MYCPNCHAEFRDGFTNCSDCDVALVAGDPPESRPGDHRDEEAHELLLVTSDVPYLSLVQSLLDGAGIEHLVQGQEALGMLTVLPSGLGGPDNVGARVFVWAKDLELARKIVEASSEDPPA